jgi:hypothetical protein
MRLEVEIVGEKVKLANQTTRISTKRPFDDHIEQLATNQNVSI